MMDDSASERFAGFFETAEPKLRRALTSAYGADVGPDATAEALAWGWQNWTRVEAMDNPVGYLFRVGQSSARRLLDRRSVTVDWDPPVVGGLPETDPAVEVALVGMPRQQRVAVVLVHGYGYRHREAAQVLGCSKSTVANHVERAMAKLRSALGVSDHA